MQKHLPAALTLSILTSATLATPSAEAALLIGNTRGNSILIFDEVNRTLIGDFTTPGANGLRDPDAITIGPDGLVYVSVGGNSGLNLLDPNYPLDSAVLKFTLQGEFVGVAASGNGLTRPYGNAFGPDGKLYVSSFRTNQILRFDGTTGAFLDVFASDNNGGLGSANGLNGPNALLFGPDGSLYVTTQGSANDVDGNLTFPFASQVLRYTPEQVQGKAPTTTPTVFIDQPALLPENPGFISLLGLTFAPDFSSLYVSDFAGGIRQYDPTGNLLSVLSTNYTGTTPSSSYFGALTFGADTTDLFAVGFNANNLLGSVLVFPDAQGSATTFSGELFTDVSLLRPIGIASFSTATAVPEPTAIAGSVLAVGGWWATRRRRSR